MKDELQTKLVEILASIQAVTAKAGDFAMEQLPEIAQSYVAYGRTSETVGFVLFTLIFAFGIWLSVFCGVLNKKSVRTWYGESVWTESRIAYSVIGGFAAAFGLMGMVINLSGLLLVWIAPKVWLLKEIAGLIR